MSKNKYWNGENYYKKQEAVSNANETIETVEEKPMEIETKRIFGVVTDCLCLNIRSGPSSDSQILSELQCLSEVEIDNNKSTEDWYHICNASGIEGYCMKKYIAIKN